MKRRDVLKTTAAFMGGTLMAGTMASVMSGCAADPSPSWTPSLFDKDQYAIVSRVVDMIIPKTDVPGALDALVDRFIDENVKNMFADDEKKQFIEGLAKFNKLSQASYKKDFLSLDQAQQTEILQALADESKKTDGPHIFGVMKEMTVAGFFTSEVGAKQALKYDPIPTAYHGCIDYDEVGGTWALS